MFSETVFLSYATGAFEGNALPMLKSALDVGFDTVHLMRPKDLMRTSFWKENQDILDLPRGGGYWLWKPYIILETLKKMSKGSVLIYSDAGRDERQMHRMPLLLMRLAAESPQGFIPGWRLDWCQQGRFTKRDLFINMGMDTPEMHEADQIGASWNIWTPTEEAIAFLEEWLKFACNPHNITDCENVLGFDNLPGFRDHRHDQSIMSLLCYRDRVNYLFFSDEVLLGVFRKQKGEFARRGFAKAIYEMDDLVRSFLRNTNPIYAHTVYTPFCERFVANLDFSKVRPPYRIA